MKIFYTIPLSLIITGITYVSAESPSASLSSAESSKCLDVKGSKFKDGTAVDTKDCNNSTAQIWEFFSGLTEIIVKDKNLPKRFCLDAKDVDSANSVVIWECNENPQQQWVFTEDGLLTLANNTNLCLEAPKVAGTQVRTAGCNGGSNQVWNLV